MSSFFAGSLHPCAGHFIAEHYLFDQFDQETWSYYGCLNYLTYNVGYHNEHHDFPSIPWTRLPALHGLANEFYKDLPQHKSWCMVTYRFIFDTDIGLFSRVKRAPKGASLEDVQSAGGKGDLGGLKDESMGSRDSMLRYTSSLIQQCMDVARIGSFCAGKVYEQP